MNATKKVVSNSFYLFLSWGFSTLFGYLFWVVLANLLSKADVGIFSAVLNLALFAAGLAFLGLNTVETKLLPKYAARKESEKLGGTISYISKIIIGLNILVAIIIFIFAGQLSAFYLNETALKAFSALLIVISASMLTANHLYSLQKMRLHFLTEAVASFGKVVLASFLIALGFGWLGAAGGLAISFLAIALLRARWIPFRGTADKKEIWHYAAPAFFASIGTILVNQGSIVFLSFLASAAAVGAFTIAFMFTTPIKIIPQIISQAIFPVSSEEFETNQLERLSNLVAQSMRYSYLVTAPLAIAFVFFAREFLAIFARQYVSEVFVFQLLAIAYLFFGLGTIITGVLYYAGKPNLNRNITLFSGIANTALIFALVPFFGIGGAAAAFLIAGMMLYFSGIAYSRKYIKVPFSGNSLLKIAIASALFAFVLAASKLADFSGAAEAAWIIVSLALASAAYLLSLLFLRFFSDVDIRILEEFEKKTPGRIKAVISFAIATVKRFSVRPP